MSEPCGSCGQRGRAGRRAGCDADVLVCAGRPNAAGTVSKSRHWRTLGRVL